MFFCNEKLFKYDLKLWNLIEKEKKRQENYIQLIASENYASSCVMEVQGSQLTNKYAEGYPGKRYYEGCKYIDKIEDLAINRAKKLFNVDYVNVQPHSGSQANFAIYQALLSPGDTILGMSLSDGGHLTHGSIVNFSGKIYKSISYGLNKKEYINYEEIHFLSKKYKPKMIVGGFSAYSRICDWEKMRKIADEINAYLLVDIAHVAGLVAANLYPSPVNYAHFVTSTTHKTLGGPRGGLILSNCKNLELYKKVNSSVFPGIQGGPLMHVIAAKAVAFKEALNPFFKKYQKQVLENAKYMSYLFLKEGYNIVSGGTNNHLFLINLKNKNITGKDASMFLNKANIIVNKNSIPNDSKNAFITSGIRIGTPSITRRGFKKPEIKKISFLMMKILENYKNINIIHSVKSEVLSLCSKFPLYLRK
ncbi:Serine hydroxymethyltransferase [Buchnera aphidicola (Tetraneura ulmi)]|uniref:serine hydroxymethyltransferase n=1 Tax=Buchnera aphidicola TaxID=9 RepID=UPI003463E52B